VFYALFYLSQNPAEWCGERGILPKDLGQTRPQTHFDALTALKRWYFRRWRAVLWQISKQNKFPTGHLRV